MTDETDTWRTAKLLVDQHGADAPIHAAMKADEMLDAGNMDGKLVWLRIKAAVEQLLSKVPEGPVH